MQIGSDEHKQLFCQTFVDTHRRTSRTILPWPEFDEVSLAQLRAIPVWTMALEVEINAGSMLAGFAGTEADPRYAKRSSSRDTKGPARAHSA